MNKLIAILILTIPIAVQAQPYDPLIPPPQIEDTLPQRQMQDQLDSIQQMQQQQLQLLLQQQKQQQYDNMILEDQQQQLLNRPLYDNGD